MARTAQVLHLAESPNDSFLLRAELADEGIPCQLLSLAPGEDLARAVTRSSIDLLIVDVPLSSTHWRSGLDEIQRARPELPVIFRWGGAGHWSTESAGEQLGRRIRGVLSLPESGRRTELEKREFLDRLVRHQQTYLELLRADTWDFDTATRRVIERAADLLEVERVSVWEFTADRKALVCLDLFVRSTRAHERPGPVSSCPRYLATLESSLTLAADDACDDPRTSELAEAYLRPLGITSMLDAPIRRDGKLVGVVCHEHIGAPRQWSVLEQCSSGWVAGLIARAMDVRERRQLAERLERAERLDSIGRLAGGLAHDFNNCLTAILCHVDLALDSPDAASTKKSLDEIRALAHSASTLTRDLLTAGRAAPVTMVPMDLAALIGGLAARLTALMPAAGRLEIAPTAAPVWIRGDAAALERVVINLVSNAADAIEETGGHVRLTLKPAAAESGAPVPSAASAAIEIVDDGVGMDAATQARLFEPFFTTKGGNGDRRAMSAGAGAGAAPMTARAHGGTGLGLATAFGIVRQHGGTIAVESAPRQGSRFTVLLPAIPRPA